MEVDTYSIVLRWSGMKSFCERRKPQWRSSRFQFSRTLSHSSSFDVETDRSHDKSFKSFGEQRSITSNQTLTASHEFVSIRRLAPQRIVQFETGQVQSELQPRVHKSVIRAMWFPAWSRRKSAYAFYTCISFPNVEGK